MSDARDLMVEDFERSGIGAKYLKRLHVQPLSPRETKAITGKRVPAYRRPFFDMRGTPTDHFRVRFLGEVLDRNDKPQRYYSPKGQAPAAYFSPLIKWPCSRKERAKVGTFCFTEGEKKGDKACLEGIPTIALEGVYNFQSAKRGMTLLPELERFRGSTGEIVFDSNRKTNRNVAIAEQRLALVSDDAGISVRIVLLPDGVGGLDDYLLSHTAEEFRKLPRITFGIRERIAATRKSKLGPREQRETVSGIALAAMQANGAFYIANDEPLYFDAQERRLYSVDSPRNPAMRAYGNEHFGINASELEWQHTHADINAHALRKGRKTQVHIFAHWKKSTGALYIAAGADELLKVTTDEDVVTLPNGADDVLMRPPSSLDPIKPASSKPDGASFKLITELLNFATDRSLAPAHAKLLYEAWIWALLFPEAMPTRPIVLAHGPHGSAKSTAGRALQRTLMGPRAEVSDVSPSKLDAVDAALVNNHLIVLDNVDGRHSGLENQLALAATGGMIVRRKLYSDNEQVSQRIQARVFCTTREPNSFTRDDIVSRLLYLPCSSRETFVSEAELLQRIDDNRPAFWRYVLSIAPKICDVLTKQQRCKPLPYRMADFAQFALQIAPVLGWSKEEVIAAFDALEVEKLAFSSEHSLLPEALRLLAKSYGAKAPNSKQWMSASEMLEAVTREWDRGPFPFRNAQSFGTRLQNDLQMLRQSVGIEAKYSSAAKAWRYKLTGEK